MCDIAEICWVLLRFLLSIPQCSCAICTAKSRHLSKPLWKRVVLRNAAVFKDKSLSVQWAVGWNYWWIWWNHTSLMMKPCIECLPIPAYPSNQWQPMHCEVSVPAHTCAPDPELREVPRSPSGKSRFSAAAQRQKPLSWDVVGLCGEIAL